MKTQKIRKFCKKAKKVIGRGHTIPILNNVLIQDNKMIVTNLEQTVILKGVEFSINNSLIPLEFLKGVAEKTSDIDFVIENQEITIQTPESYYNITNHDDLTDYPKLAEFGEIQEDVIYVNDIKRMKKSVVYTDDTEIRPVMNYVNVNTDYIVASDSHILSYHKRERKGEFQFLVPKGIIAILEDSKYRVIRDENNVYFEGIHFDYMYREIEKNYPNWQSVLPESHQYNSDVVVDAKILKDTMQEADIVANQSSHLVKLYNSIDKSVLNIRSQDIGFGAEYNNNIEVENFGEAIVIGIKSLYLLRILNMEEYDNVKIQFKSSSSLVVNDEVLLMAMNLGKKQSSEYEPSEEQLNQKPKRILKQGLF